MMNKIYYFAYGSNMSEKRMINRGLNPLNKQVGYLDGYKFIINKKSKKNPENGFANVIHDDDSIVEGIVYEVLESDMKKLDRFEGFPIHYGRENLKIRLLNNSYIDGVVYIANFNWVSKTELKTTKEYKDYILEGKEYISENYYEFLNENIKI